jgi:hypothetical protein
MPNVLPIFVLAGVLVLVQCAPVGQPNGPDLVVTSVSAPAVPVSIGDVIVFGCIVKNIGNEAAGAFDVEYRVGTGSSPTGADPLIGTVSVPGLQPGETFSDSQTCSATLQAKGVGTGTRTLFAIADTGSTVAETAEGNNYSGSSLAVNYTRLIIDTYDATTEGPLYVVGDGGYSIIASYNVEAALYAASDLVTPLASNDGNSGRPVTSLPEGFSAAAYAGFAYIDYQVTIPPGDYYVKVTVPSPAAVGHTQAYALRAIAAPDYAYGTYASWIFTAGEVPATPSNDADWTSATHVSLNGKTVKLLAGGDTNWFRITLP